jgi:tRNA 2-thiouridine synthesizing protein A
MSSHDHHQVGSIGTEVSSSGAKTRKALKSLTPGDRLEVRCTDPLAVIDIPHLVGVTGDRLEIIVRSERDTVFRIEKSAPTLASKPPLC